MELPFLLSQWPAQMLSELMKEKKAEIQSTCILFQALPHHIVFCYRECSANLTGVLDGGSLHLSAQKATQPSWRRKESSRAGE